MARSTANFWDKKTAYENWIESTGAPIHRGYYIEDCRTLALGYWAERECDAAFIQLVGQEGVTGAYVTEIPPGKTLSSFRVAVDEVVYVLQGRGLASVWAGERAKKVFEWQSYSMFLVPGNYHCQLSNMQGDQSVRLLHCSYLPLAMSVLPDRDMFFNNPLVDYDLLYAPGAGVYSEAKATTLDEPGTLRHGRNIWFGNFFPDMRAWDWLDHFEGRGAGGHVVWVGFPNSPLSAHMSVFPARTYKKGHRHGPGYLIVIPAGEGYSIMWPEGGDKIIIPWHEASLFVPPNRWFHQHFNIGGAPARYLAIHPPRGLNGISEKVEDRAKDQIEYPDEDPMIRKKFESALAQKGLQSVMPDEAYQKKAS
jgi:hypothetical protein